jgi:ABC-type transporter Mla subunit MlaD
MSEDVFRWAVTAGVALSWIMTLITAGAALAMYRTSKRIEQKVDPLIEKAGPILDKSRAIVDETGPKVRDIMDKATEMTATLREQVQRLDALVTETAERARLQIDHIDAVVNDTVNRVQETTIAVQTTVLRPVREVNGVVSGLRAAISTLGRRNRASVDHATADEEMFI